MNLLLIPMAGTGKLTHHYYFLYSKQLQSIINQLANYLNLNVIV